eukprot:4466584-Alexandrium_andersonii.AAC.1
MNILLSYVVRLTRRAPTSSRSVYCARLKMMLRRKGPLSASTLVQEVGEPTPATPAPAEKP